MDVAGFLERLQASPGYGDQIVHQEVIPQKAATYGTLSRPLDSRLEAALAAQDIHGLYQHQAAAIQAVREGRHVVVATGAASGKSICYQVPVLEALLQDRSSRSLLLFPTKALAQDQLRALRALSADRIPLGADIFDGDTPRDARSQVKRSAQVVITNPDMLHLGILPNHKSWARLFSNLRYVVLDEAHVYRGVFGSNVANVIRRLRRLCRQYGSNPQFILCSATLANPGELAKALVGLPFTVVDQNGSPFGGKRFVFWDPPILDEAKGRRRSATSEAATLFGALLLDGVRTLAFARTRRQAEMMYLSVRQRLAEQAPHLVSRISPYRASYLPEDRRRIERALFSGELMGVAATNALELGIDIGSLDATVLAGYPGSIASAWQQAGRSGRRQEESFTALVARDDPLDQYLMRHPDFFFGRPHEHALIAPQNPHILDKHLLCAAFEAPLMARDAGLFGTTFEQRVAALQEKGSLRFRQERWFLDPGIAYPAEDVGIRSSSTDSYAVVERPSGALLEKVSRESAFFQLHPGAVYLHYGEQYLVEELDLVSKTAYVSARDVPYYTMCRDVTDIRLLRLLQEKRAGTVRVFLSEVEVTTQVVSYEKKAQFNDESLGEEMLDLPPQRFPTVALGLDLPETLVVEIRKQRLDLAGGLHAAEHAAIGVLPLFALCDRSDIGGVSTPLHPDTGKPQVFIYDGHEGGIGIAEKGYEIIEELWAATLRAIEECPCEDGCPSCIQSPKCGNGNHPLDKKVATMLLRGALGMDAI
ncbi:MAG: DEAD/DEAH box helicase [Dehalococcoidia bacterium]|nr:DEAD/DEAH box helicase [Dehalococcoidia bacterium]